MKIPIRGLLLLLAAGPVAGQTPAGSARLRGQGLFRFTSLAPGNYSVLVRAIGWKPLIFELTMQAEEEWVGRLGLEPVPVRLPELVVTGRYGKPAKYANTT